MLDAWRDSPARFRADANLTDDVSLVGYRDRVIVELAQNAADAATRAGVPGRLLVELRDDLLMVANTGAPLTSDGVESIAVSRASAKRGQDGAIGRFGVGFGAVLSVSDAPLIQSTTGAVSWSLAAARDAVDAVPELRGEAALRDGRLPVLRLPFPAEGSPPSGFDTAILLPLRDDAARSEVRRQLEAVDETLLLSFPSLGEVVVRLDGAQRRLDRSELSGRWQLAAASGPLDPDRRESLPVEERQAGRWQVSWAIPVAGGAMTSLPPSTARVVRAPTPTDDPLSIPAVLVASYPLDAARRRVVPGRLATDVTERAAETLVATIAELPPTRRCSRCCRPGCLTARSTRHCTLRSPGSCAARPGSRPPATLPSASGRPTPSASTTSWSTPSSTSCRPCCHAAGRIPHWLRSVSDGPRWRSWSRRSPTSVGSRPGGLVCTPRSTRRCRPASSARPWAACRSLWSTGRW